MLAKNKLLENIVESLGNAPPIDEQVMHNFFDIDIVQYGLYDVKVRPQTTAFRLWSTLSIQKTSANQTPHLEN